MVTSPANAAGTSAGTARGADPFSGRVAIVTGGASGIGAALVRALAARGAVVVIADVDEAGADEVARQTGAGAAAVDVTDASSVAELVDWVIAEHGRLDLMFNNAGIAIGGMVDELTLDHWDRVIDVNVRGVVHGVHAAYPVMLRQGSGHIVNTASLAGLVPGPGLAPYAAAKHAVVGMSLSLRAEAAGRGVRVSAVCPGFVDTPLLGRVNPGLPQTETGANAVALARTLGKLYQADPLAADILRGIVRNRALIVAPGSARIAWRMARYAPRLTMRTIVAGIRRQANAEASAGPATAAGPGAPVGAAMADGVVGPPAASEGAEGAETDAAIQTSQSG